MIYLSFGLEFVALSTSTNDNDDIISNDNSFSMRTKNARHTVLKMGASGTVVTTWVRSKNRFLRHTSPWKIALPYIIG
jgi:hypothetical protein